MCVVHVSPAGLSIYTRLWKPKNAYVVVFAKWCIYWEQDKLTALVFLGAVLGTSVTILIKVCELWGEMMGCLLYMI